MANPDARPLRIALVAGEASGDTLGAGLIRALRARHPDCECAGIGGADMRAAGLDAWHDCDELAVMGLFEVVRHLPRLLGLRRRLLRRLRAWRPDVYVGIDAPDFNLAVERKLRALNVRTVHYVSPSIWAWRQGRARTIGASAERVLCLFPFEPAIYARFGVEARFVGHPLADAFADQPNRHAARAELGLADDASVLALLPGSRHGEISRLLPIFLAAARQLREAVPALRIVIPSASRRCAAQIDAALDAQPNIDALRLDGGAHTALIAADAVLLASGTAALEALLAKRPMLVAYRISALTHFLVTRLGLMRVKRYSLPNALAERWLVPELIQHDCTASAIAAALLPWLQAPDAGTALYPAYAEIHASLRGGGSAAAAAAVLELLDVRSAPPATPRAQR